MGTNAFLPSGEATTSCPVTPPSTMVATCRPLSGSTRLRVWSPLLATSSNPADEDEGPGESGVRNIAKMNVIARNQVMLIPLRLLAPYYRTWTGTTPANVQRGVLCCPLAPRTACISCGRPGGLGRVEWGHHRHRNLSLL